MVRSTLLTLITKVGFEACLETYVVCFPSFSSLPPFDYSALGRDPASLKRRQTSQRCCCALLHQLLRSLLRGAEHRCISPLPETASSFRKSWSVRITFFSLQLLQTQSAFFHATRLVSSSDINFLSNLTQPQKKQLSYQIDSISIACPTSVSVRTAAGFPSRR